MNQNCFVPNLKICLHKRFSEYINLQTNKFPIHVEISPTGYCNAKCPWCFYKDNQERKILDYDAIIDFISQLSRNGTDAISWTGGGEPSLHPNFDEISSFVFWETNLAQGMFTNGLVVTYNPTHFDWIRVSKTDANWPEDNIKKIRQEAKEVCRVGMCLNYSGQDSEMNDIIEGLRIVHENDLDYLQIRPWLELGGTITDVKMPNIKDPKLFMTEYKFDEAKKEKEYTECRGYHFVPFVWEDGEVNACGYQRGKNGYILGNIYEESFEKIIKKYPKFVKVNNNCQTCCRNHEINKTIDKSLKIEDRYFV